MNKVLKNILMMVLLTLFPCIALANGNINGACHNSYFIEKKMNILDTMNLLITGTQDTNNSFTCQSFNLYQTKNQEYKLDVNTEYNSIPYVLEFIGKQAPNNNGLVFIPSDVILINYRTEQIVSHFEADKIIGACNMDIKHIHNGDTLSCLIALNKGDGNSIAVKIHFK